MRSRLARALALPICLLLLSHVPSLPLAATGDLVVQGLVRVENGAIRPGMTVRMTTQWSEPLTAPVGEDGFYELRSGLSKGTYQFDVIGPEGQIYNPVNGFTTLPSSGSFIVNLSVRLEPGDPHYQPPSDPEPSVPPVQAASKGFKKKLIWGLVGGALGAVSLASVAGGDGESCQDTSPSQPGCQE